MLQRVCLLFIPPHAAVAAGGFCNGGHHMASSPNPPSPAVPFSPKTAISVLASASGHLCTGQVQIWWFQDQPRCSARLPSRLVPLRKL